MGKLSWSLLPSKTVTYKFSLGISYTSVNNSQAQEMVSFLKSLGDIYPNELKAAFKRLHQKLLTYEDHPYERRAFLYLDIISWLESKIENKSTADIIKEKFTKININN